MHYLFPVISEHNFDLKITALITGERNLLMRKCIENALITRPSTVNLCSGFYNISSFLADLLSQRVEHLIIKMIIAKTKKNEIE